MEDDGADLVPGGQVDGGHGADALAVQDDVLRGNAVLGAKVVPGRVHVGVQVLLARLAGARAVAGVIVAEDVAVDAGTCVL